MRLPLRLTGLTRGWRRRVLARRRLLAALAAAVAVWAGLRAISPPEQPQVLVRVAAADLPAGTVLEADDLARSSYPPALVPDRLAGDPVGRTLAAPLRRGEPVTDLRLVQPGLTAGYPGLVAVPVRLPDAGSAALLRAGDRVDLLATDPATGGTTRVVTGATVLALPPRDETSTAGGLTGRLVVLGVPQALVTRVVSAGVTDFVTWSFTH